MQRKVFVVLFVSIAIVLALFAGLRSFRQARRADQVPKNTPVNTIQPSQDLGDCTVIGSTKNTQTYDQVAGVDPKFLSMDIYVPKTKGACTTKYPLMIYVHGGAWQIGDKGGQIQNKSTYFPSKGYVFVSVNYRLAPAVMYPVFNQDVAQAVKYVFNNATRYGADKNKITIMGHSAGGGIISAVSTDEKYLQTVGLPLNTLKCAVSIDTEGYDISAKASENTKAYEAPFGQDENVWREASPINHISSDKGIPSFFIATRGNKTRVAGARAFQQKLDQAGVFTALIEVPSLDHEGINAAVGDPQDTLITPKLQEFLNTRCK